MFFKCLSSGRIFPRVIKFNMPERHQPPLIRNVTHGPVEHVELNRVYSFNLEQPSFPGLSSQKVNELYRDGRVSSKPLELMLCSDDFFPSLTYVDAKGFDYVSTQVGLKSKLDLKGFTSNGAKYMPSCMIGQGRTMEASRFHTHARDMTYIFCDITEFPEINVVFKDGEELIQKYPRGVITKLDRNSLFSN